MLKNIKNINLNKIGIIFVAILILTFIGSQYKNNLSAESPKVESQPSLYEQATAKIEVQAQEEEEQPLVEEYKSILDSLVITTPKEEEKLEILPTVEDQVIIDKINAYLVKHKSPLGGNYGKFLLEMGKKYKRHPYAVVAIIQADTSLCKKLKTKFNCGNVGNTDSGAKKSFSSWEQGLEAVFQTLINKWLGNATKLCQLSRGGWKYCPEGEIINGGKFYASSLLNWDINTTAVFSELMGVKFNRNLSILF